MTTFLIVYALSIVCVTAYSIRLLKNSDIKTVQVKEVVFISCSILLPGINTLIVFCMIIKFIDEYDKELKNPFYKEKDRD